MGYIHYGRNGLRHVFRFKSSTGVVTNSARSQPRSCAPLIGNVHFSTTSDSRIVQDLLAEVERDRLRERNERLRLGLDTADIDAEPEQDYMGVGPLIAKLEKEKEKQKGSEDLNRYEEPTDSDDDSDEETQDDADKRHRDFERKYGRHKDLLKSFTDAETLDEAFNCMTKIDKFEHKHFRLRPEYRVIGELTNRLKVATEQKDRFVLQNKLNRALRLVQWKEAYDPDNPANYGVIQREQPDAAAAADAREEAELEKEKEELIGEGDNADEEEEEFDDMKEKDNILLAKLEAIDRKLEEKLAELEYTFGRKGKALEEEIKDLAEDRNELTEQKRKPLYRKVAFLYLHYSLIFSVFGNKLRCKKSCLEVFST